MHGRKNQLVPFSLYVRYNRTLMLPARSKGLAIVKGCRAMPGAECGPESPVDGK